MEKFSFDDYVEKRYNDQLKYYSSASRKNQKKYNDFQWTLIILSTLTTIMAALPDSLMLFKTIKIEFKYLIVITSGIVTILTAGLKTFKYEELWYNYRKTAEKLKPHIFFYHLNIGKYGKAGANKETVFVETIEDILNKEKSDWLSIKVPGEQTNQQILEEMQAKLEGMVREKFNTIKPIVADPGGEPTTPEVAEEVVEPPPPITNETEVDTGETPDETGGIEGNSDEEVAEETETSDEATGNEDGNPEESEEELPEEPPKKP